MNKSLPLFYPYGERDSGNNVLASIGQNIWKLSEKNMRYLHQLLKHDLEKQCLGIHFQIFVDEIEKLFDTNHQIVSIIKAAVQSRNARIVYTRHREKIEIPALATVTFASNHEPPLDEATNKRFCCIRFTKTDTKTKQEQQRFEKEILDQFFK